MGDRVLIQFKSGKELSPVVYLHWGGGSVAKLLLQTSSLLRTRGADVSYTCARFIGYCHAENPDSALSLGVWNQKTKLSAKDSHGDAGCIVVDVSDRPWQFECSGGYLNAEDLKVG